MDHFKFRVDLIQALLIERGSETERTVQGHHSSDKNVPRLLERHFTKRIPLKEKTARPAKRCVVCCKHNKRKETVFECPDSQAGLCLEGCFKTFHTKLNF
jgi:hypothetical protein